MPPQQKPVMETSLKSTSTYVRVDIEKLDRILNTISELNLARAATNRIAREISEAMGNTPLVIDIFKIAQTFGRRLAELQGQVLARPGHQEIFEGNGEGDRFNPLR